LKYHLFNKQNQICVELQIVSRFKKLISKFELTKEELGFITNGL